MGSVMKSQLVVMNFWSVSEKPPGLMAVPRAPTPERTTCPSPGIVTGTPGAGVSPVSVV